jgi:heme-degrading monooxygenase HmoA
METVLGGDGSGYMIIWEYVVKPGMEKCFEESYGPIGEWVQLFARGEGYLHTELHRDAVDGRRYATIDCWVSRAAYDAFREEWREELDAIDARCSALTERETHLGSFVRLGRSSPMASRVNIRAERCA